MYNRKLRRRKFRRNATVSDFTGGEPTGFTSIPEARAFLLRHADLCKLHFDPNETTPVDADVSLLRSIENAARLIKKADRRNYRRQTKSAVKKIIKNKKYLPLLSASAPKQVSELEYVRFEELQEALKSLSAAIGKALEIESSDTKAERKVRTYISNTRIGGKSIGVTGADGISRLPDFLEEMVSSLFDTQIKRLSKSTSFERRTGINLVRSSDESSFELPALPRRALRPRAPEQMELSDDWGAPEEIEEEDFEEEQPPHSYEVVVGPAGELITFRINRTVEGRIRAGKSGIARARTPSFREGEVILSMIQAPKAYIIDPDGDIILDELGITVREGELTAEMQNSYQNSFLYFVRKYAADGRRKDLIRALSDAPKKVKYGKSKKSRKLRKKKK